MLADRGEVYSGAASRRAESYIRKRTRIHAAAAEPPAQEHEGARARGGRLLACCRAAQKPKKTLLRVHSVYRTFVQV